MKTLTSLLTTATFFMFLTPALVSASGVKNYDDARAVATCVSSVGSAAALACGPEFN